MKEVWWMAGASVGSWLVATAVLGLHTGVDVLLGMMGPLAAVIGTWVMAEQTYRRHPGRLTSLMIAAFGVKVLFFGVYVTVVLTALSPGSIPFVVSFMSYFIALYLLEALYLRRLFADRAGAER